MGRLCPHAESHRGDRCKGQNRSGLPRCMPCIGTRCPKYNISVPICSGGSAIWGGAHYQHRHRSDGCHSPRPRERCALGTRICAFAPALCVCVSIWHYMHILLGWPAIGGKSYILCNNRTIGIAYDLPPSSSTAPLHLGSSIFFSRARQTAPHTPDPSSFGYPRDARARREPPPHR